MSFSSRLPFAIAVASRLSFATAVVQAISLLAACNFPKPADVPGEAGSSDASTPSDATSDGLSVDGRLVDAAPDAPDLPGTAIRVSPTGDDANDGFSMPVKTLKHAIGLAAANRDVIHIVLASGRYSAATGETFPYTVPPNVTVIGPAGGGATLAGTNAEPGMSVNVGGLQDVDLEDFTTAITATGAASLKNVRVRTSAIGVQGETAADLTASNLEIGGTVGACATGVVLNGSAQLVATMFTTRNLGKTLDAKDQSKAIFDHANITGDSTCSQSFLGVFTVGTSNTFSLDDSLVDGGVNGIHFVSPTEPTHAAITNTTIRNTKGAAILGRKVIFQMTGGQLVNDQNAFGVDDGVWTVTNVTITQQRGFALELGNGNMFTMRGCVHTANAGGIYLTGNLTLDLGTSVSPGNNTFQNGDMRTGLEVDSASHCSVINAVGNTWRPNVQGADGNGRYSAQSIPGPTTILGGNFAFPAPCTLQL